MANRKEYNTKTKKNIISYLLSQNTITLSAKDIYYYLKMNDANLNLSTVYRNLEILHKEGIVQKFLSSNGKTSVYQYVERSGNCHEHLHIQCIKCGELLHLNCDYMNEFLDNFTRHLYEHHEFSLEFKQSMLYGFCNSCK